MNGVEPAPRRELRRHVRHLVKQMFEVHVEAPGEPAQRCRLWLEDVSTGGLRLGGGLPAGEGPLVLTFFLEEPYRFQVRPVWSKADGEKRVAGLEFQVTTEEESRRVEEFVRRCLPAERRRNDRVACRLPVRLTLGPGEYRHAVTSDISTSGLGVLHSEPIPEGVELRFLLTLEPDGDPVEVTGRVVWQKEIFLEQYHVGVEFVEIPSEAVHRLEEFVAAALTESAGGSHEVVIRPPGEDG